MSDGKLLEDAITQPMRRQLLTELLEWAQLILIALIPAYVALALCGMGSWWGAFYTSVFAAFMRWLGQTLAE